jgi:hypothetical protein
VNIRRKNRNSHDFMLRRTSFTLVLFILLVHNGSAQVSEKATIRFLFYNVENFFDTKDDTARQDNDFLPGGSMHWDSERYADKIQAVYKVIAAAGGWEAPAIVGFCEVEKKSVLRDIIYNTYLLKYNYGIIHEESDDVRGIDVCLIFRRDLVRPLSYKYLKPVNIPEGEFRTRSVLYSKWLISSDTIHLFLNHWPSKRGGVLAEQSLRNIISLMVREKTDSLLSISNQKAKIVIAGDFNCTPDDPEIKLLSAKNNDNGKTLSGTGLVNLSQEASDKGSGTYKYQGIWEMLDQVIVSDGLIRCREGFCTDKNSFKVFNPDFLLKKDPVYPGFATFSTYKGLSYEGGFSDHLPVILDLERK